MTKPVATVSSSIAVPGTPARLTLLACILSSSLIGVDSVMTMVALPSIAEDLDAGLAVQQWVVAGFLLGLGCLLLVGGALGDVYDRWVVFGVGTAAFGAAALLCALAPNAPVLIAGRLAQGAAAALVVPSALAVITTSYSGAERSRAIGTWTAWSGVSIITGPVLGGLLLEAFSWRAIYGVLVPLSGIVLLLIVRVASAAPHPKAASVDRGGALLSVPLVGGPVFALIEGPEIGWGSPLVIGALLVGLLSGAAFLWWERRARNPLLPLLLFASRTFTVLNIVTFVLYGALISSGVYLILFLQQTAGYSPTASALAASIPIMLLFLLSRRFGTLADRYGPRTFVAGGSLVVGIGILLLLRADENADFFAVVLPSVFVHGVGLSMIVAPLTAGVLSAVGDEHAGVASGVNNAVARIGSLLTIAVVGVLISIQFSGAVDRNLEGQELSATAQNAVEEARDRPLATTPAAGLGSTEHRLIEQALTDASTSAFRVGVGAIGGLALLAAIFGTAGAYHRHRRYEAAGCPGGALAGAHDDHP